MKKSLTIAAAAAVAMLAGCAPYEEDPAYSAASAEDGRDCFFLSQVNGFNDAPEGPNGEDRIYVSTGPSETYLFETFGACPDLNYSETIAFDQNGPGTICRGIDVDLIVPTSIGPRRCPVSMIRKLTPEEEAAR